MKQCKCGFSYERKEDLEMVNLVQSEGVIKYYCPDCKEFKTSEKFDNDSNLKSKTVDADVNIEFVDSLYEGKKDVLWYGGTVCNIMYKDFIFNIVANGDVRGTIYENGEELTTFKDKCNGGSFYHVLNSYLPEIKTDEQLYEILNSDLTEDEIKEKKLTAIVLDNNNWWEAFVDRIVDGPENEFIDSFTIDISDNIDECIDYILTEKENLYNHFSEDLN